MAAAISMAFFIRGVASESSTFRAFVTAATSALLAMGVLGLARGLWGGDQVEEMEAPGGWRVKLAQATRKPLRTLERRVDSQMTQVNERLFDLERAVFKDPVDETDQQD